MRWEETWEKEWKGKWENLYTLPLVHKLVGERISGLTLHNIRFSRFIGKGNGWDLSWPAQDKRQTKGEKKKKKRQIWDQIHKEWTLKAGHCRDDNGMHGRPTHKHRWQKVENPGMGFGTITALLCITMYWGLTTKMCLGFCTFTENGSNCAMERCVTSFYTLQWQWSLVHISGTMEGEVQHHHRHNHHHLAAMTGWRMDEWAMTCSWWSWEEHDSELEGMTATVKRDIWEPREHELYLINFSFKIGWLNLVKEGKTTPTKKSPATLPQSCRVKGGQTLKYQMVQYKSITINFLLAFIIRIIKHLPLS